MVIEFYLINKIFSIFKVIYMLLLKFLVHYVISWLIWQMYIISIQVKSLLQLGFRYIKCNCHTHCNFAMLKSIIPANSGSKMWKQILTRLHEMLNESTCIWLYIQILSITWINSHFSERAFFCESKASICFWNVLRCNSQSLAFCRYSCRTSYRMLALLLF